MGIFVRIFLSCLVTFFRLLFRLLKWLITGPTPDDRGTNTGVQVNRRVAEGSGDTNNADSQAWTKKRTFTGATPDGRGTNTGIQVNRRITDGSDDANRADSWAWTEKRTYAHETSPSPSDTTESKEDVYLPSAPRETGALQVSVAPKPSSPDFWEMVKEYEKPLQDYVPRMLSGAAAYFKSTKFTDVASNMHHIVKATSTFRDNIKGALDARGITIDKLTEELEGIFMGIVKDLEKIPTPDKAPGHADRAEMVDKVLDDTALALVNLATRYGIEEEVVTTYLTALKPHVQALTIAVGDINEQHPKLLPAVAFSVATLLIPESWILRPFLSVFGFGPAGPVKGSTAAWLQSRFWGATVKSGSWFSLLQKAGMGVYPKWVGLVAEVPLLVGNLLALLPPLRRE